MYKRVVFVLAASAVAVAGLAAFTASNTVPESRAGDGARQVSGYTVSGVHYTLNASSPQNVDAVGFTLDQAPVAGSTIKVRLSSTSSNWYSCTNAGAAVTCATTSPQATVTGADELRVVIAD
jgi:hypothetical protein